MLLRYKTILILLVLSLLMGAHSEAVEGPVLVNIDIPAGTWKAIRLKNLPRGAVVAMEVKSNGEVAVLMVNSKDYMRLPNPSRPLFLGRVKDKITFSISIPESDNYYVVLDNRSGRQGRAITVTAAAARGNTDSIEAANAILGQFERLLHRIFIFDAFRVGIEDCHLSKAFDDRSGIVLCAAYVNQLYRIIGDMQKAKDALAFSIFHELGRILLTQWDHPSSARKTAADEFTTVLMVMLNQTKTLSAHAETMVENPSISMNLKKALTDDDEPLTAKRAGNILGWLQDEQFVRRWQKFLVPHMQTAFLKRLKQHPAAWTDTELVEKELAIRSKKSIVS